ncbi:MAG TPA: alpha/beta fold hydrolase [Roseiflexaceae bacterium]|nr:alpha/beta fold hydrolase [Roseiflexaceae bacterium]
MERIAPADPIARPRRRARRWLARITISLVVLLLVAYVGISALAANILTTPRRAWSEQTPASLGLEFRDTTFPARGGDVTIAGWFIPHASAQRAIVLVHGKDSSRTEEFGGHFVDLAAGLYQRGFAVLMIDMRGHGLSGDAHFSFGLNERRDVEGAVDWLKSQGFQPGRIGVLGISMGAAASIGAAVDDSDIGALVEDCSYAEILPVIQAQWRGASGMPDFFLPSTLLMGRILFGYDVATARPVDEIGRLAPRPLLIIHGTADRLVPLAHAEQLHVAYPTAEFWQIPGAGHARSFEANPQTYVERVAGFFDRNLHP